MDKSQGRTMLLATWLHATHFACLHYTTRLQRRYNNLSPAHRVAPLLHGNGSVASAGGGGGGRGRGTEVLGINVCITRIPFVRPE